MIICAGFLLQRSEGIQPRLEHQLFHFSQIGPSLQSSRSLKVTNTPPALPVRNTIDLLRFPIQLGPWL
jgi:hypothetical protein